MTLELGPNFILALYRAGIVVVIIGVVRGVLAWASIRKIQR